MENLAQIRRESSARRTPPPRLTPQEQHPGDPPGGHTLDADALLDLRRPDPFEQE